MKSCNHLYEYPNDNTKLLLEMRQKSSLILLKFWKEFCEKEKIVWWATFGTLLGIVREKGTIKWDDDVDLGIFASDLTRIHNQIKSYILQFNNNNSNYKISLVSPHTEITLHERSKIFFPKLHLATKENYFLGFIDIFPHYTINTKRRLKQNINEAKINFKKIRNNKENFFEFQNTFLKKSNKIIYTGFEFNAIDTKQQFAFYKNKHLFPLKEISLNGNQFLIPNKEVKFLKKTYSKTGIGCPNTKIFRNHLKDSNSVSWQSKQQILLKLENTTFNFDFNI